jgi:hypothetical protein
VSASRPSARICRHASSSGDAGGAKLLSDPYTAHDLNNQLCVYYLNASCTLHR